MESNSNKIAILSKRYIDFIFLGSGFSADIYKVRDSTDDKEYALKLFKEDDSYSENEIKINKEISKSNNPSFTKYITSSVDNFTIEESNSLKSFMILELASKGSVMDYLMKDEKGLEEKFCKLFFSKLLIIVKDLHTMGICHRDLKLDNFLFDENFNIKLSDFGFSSFIKKNKNGKKKMQTEYVGTLSYMAPEIVMKIPYDGEKADIFSLGVILFNLRTCRFGFINASFNDSLYRFIQGKKIKTYWKLLGQNIEINYLSEEFKNLYSKMISFNPKERPTIEEIYNDEWLREIRDLNEQELMDLEQELINELKRRE